MALRTSLVVALFGVLGLACSSSGGDVANGADPATQDPALAGAGGAAASGSPNVAGGSANASGKVCGEGASRPCNTDEACAAGADCANAVCTTGKCIAPRPDDGVKNGDETDVDCGGSTNKACAAGAGCKIHADCTSGGCRAGTCAIAKSCRAVSGGATCGEGENDDPQAKHEDCCTAIDIPRPAASGGPYRLDKYLITAGRMRAFIEETSGNVRGWVAMNTPPGWTTAMDASVPANATDVAQQLGA